MRLAAFWKNPLAGIRARFRAAPPTRGSYWSSTDIARFFYRQCLDREPEPDALRYWAGRLDAGEDLPAVYEEIRTCPEATTRLETSRHVGGRSLQTGEVVRFLYRQCLDREPEPDVLPYWARRLQTLEDLQAVYREIRTSPEAVALRGPGRLSPSLDGFNEAEIVDRFHQLYYAEKDGWPKNTLIGYPILQCPFDLYLYQEVISNIRPACVVQTGVASGGSLLYFACLLDLTGIEESVPVIGVDIRLSSLAKTLTHPRIRLIEGNSIDSDIVAEIKRMVCRSRGLVALDSDHSQSHVAEELRIYGELVAVGSYLVAEDTNINGHPAGIGFGPGPFEAVNEFLGQDTRFVRDDALWRRNKLSFHQFGWLKRIRE